MSVELPPLPMLDLSRENLYGYTADQMRAYAAEALKARKPLTDDLVEALELVLDGVGALTKRHELEQYIDASQVDFVFSALKRAHGIGEQS